MKTIWFAKTIDQPLKKYLVSLYCNLWHLFVLIKYLFVGLPKCKVPKLVKLLCIRMHLKSSNTLCNAIIFYWHNWVMSLDQNLCKKLGLQSAICWNSLGLFKDYSQNHLFLEIELFCYKIEGWKFQHLFEKKNSWQLYVKWSFLTTGLVARRIYADHCFAKLHDISQNFNSFSKSDNFHFHFFYLLSDWVEILWGVTKLQTLYILENKKVLFLEKICFRQ